MATVAVRPLIGTGTLRLRCVPYASAPETVPVAPRLAARTATRRTHRNLPCAPHRA
ncbi:hypothetical protein FRAAL2014 [Frankia alni ACN14a]|uniref:Uncharacterized protein n=1 Tax=Frankia alni (strain DSM 45986 / CECT 9034 / ACN14a) TaxID=326424 RepID=Q0RP70_FRAAA|nr:hypothetical protein FRAAL2014 [Frankia alni ACN14a]